MDFHEAAVRMGSQPDLHGTTQEAMKAVASILDAHGIRLEITDPTSRAILGTNSLHLDGMNRGMVMTAARASISQPIGNIAVMHLELEENDRNRELLRLLSGRIELAWRNQIQKEEIQSIRAELSNRRNLDRKIGRALARVTNTSELAREIEGLLSSVLHIQHTGFYFLDPETMDLKLGFAKNLEDWEIEDAERTAWDRHPGHVIRTGETIDVPDTRSDEDRITSTSLRRQTIRSRLYVPVRCGSDVIGALGLASNQVDAFSDEHRDILSFLTDIAGLTWGRIREGKKRERRERLMRATSEISSRLLTTTDWRTTGTELLELLSMAVEADSASIIEFSNNDEVATPVSSWPDAPPPDAIIDFAMENVSRLSAGTSVSSEPNPGSGKATNRTGSEQGESMIGVPIRFGRTTLATLVVRSTHSRGLWDEVTGDAIRTVATAITSAESRTRLEYALRHSQKLEAIGTLAGGIAHDFNNLLWPILAFTQILKDKSKDTADRNMLIDIETAADRATELVAQILDMSRHVKPNKEVANLRSVTNDALRLLKRSLPSSVNLVIDLEDVGNANLDIAGYNQVILNLCTNASQAMTRGGMLSLKLFKGDRNHACLIIQDEGSGMDEHTLAHLFDPYFTTKGSTGGTGLGLTIVQKIIEELGGTIETFSRKGTGTRQTVRIPLTENAVQEHVKDLIEDHVASREGLRVFVVDDEPGIGNMCREMLEYFEYEAELFLDGRSLLERIDRDDDLPDAIITDLSMPEMDGIELTRCLRRRSDDIPIICCTGFGSESVEKEAYDAGVSAFARKPLGLEEFGKLVKAVLEERTGAIS